MSEDFKSNAIEYFNRELKKARINLERAKNRNATKIELINLKNKCEYYLEAVKLMKGE